SVLRSQHSSSVLPRRPPIPTLFPYTTLFRSHPAAEAEAEHDVDRAHHEALAHRYFARLAMHDAEVENEQGEHDCEKGKPHPDRRSEEHTSELQSRFDLVCRLLLEKKKKHRTQ